MHRGDPVTTLLGISHRIFVIVLLFILVIERHGGISLGVVLSLVHVIDDLLCDIILRDRVQVGEFFH